MTVCLGVQDALGLVPYARTAGITGLTDVDSQDEVTTQGPWRAAASSHRARPDLGSGRAAEDRHDIDESVDRRSGARAFTNAHTADPMGLLEPSGNGCVSRSVTETSHCGRWCRCRNL